MRPVVTAALALTMSACTAVALGPQVHGAQRVIQDGYSFVTPANKSWTVLVRSTYQVTLGARGENANETLIVSASTYQIPAFAGPQDFLAYVKSGRANEPKTGQFEILRNNEELYTDRSEICVRHETESKDFGAKRGGDYTVIQYVGMNCIHPKNSAVGIFVELSRKALPGVEHPMFKTIGSQVLKSVEFSAYK